MYDTLTNISIGPSKFKPSLNLKKRTTIPRDMRSPAIPITPYQYLGAKAWEASPKSPKPKSAKKKHFSLPSKLDSPTKWYKLSSRGSNKASAGEKEAEKRREELRKRIVVIGAADQFPDGRHHFSGSLRTPYCCSGLGLSKRLFGLNESNTYGLCAFAQSRQSSHQNDAYQGRQ
ncbi:MAG: hypothetical protein Q9187_009195 [Circinaria calcarea]